MHENKIGSKVLKLILIAICIIFVLFMLVLPLITVITEALRKGWDAYQQAVTD